MGDVKAVDAMTHDGLTNPFTGKQMINEASEVGNELELTRPDMDRFAARSHQLAAKATEEGRLAEEIVPVTVKSPQVRDDGRAPTRRSAPTPRRSASPACRAIGGDDATHTAGNAPGVNDGAGAVVVASAEWAEAQRQAAARPDRRLRDGRRRLRLPRRGPRRRPRSRRSRRSARQPGDVEIWEINEAFASVALNSIRMLGIDEDKVNVNGGAIALGHPIGASGGRIIGALVHELQRRGGGLGCAAICSGGGQGDAILVEV